MASGSLRCDDYEQVMVAFKHAGTVFRGLTEGPNHRTLEVFENVATGRGIAIVHSEDLNIACAVSFNFDFKTFSQQATIVAPPIPE